MLCECPPPKNASITRILNTYPSFSKNISDNYNVKYHINKFFGFTLSEVLITLGIIGIVAAMTLPSVIGNAKNKQRSAALKKAYTTLYQAIMISTQEHGDITEWELPPYHAKGMLNWANEYIGKYFQITSACEDGNTKAPCATSVDRICNANNPSNCSSIGLYTALYVLNDGSHIYIFSGGNPVNGKSDFVHILIDTNGIHKPNLFGKDVFTFTLSLSNNKKPFQSYPSPDNESRESLLNTCKNSSSQCSGLLQYDNWEFKKDYPW